MPTKVSIPSSVCRDSSIRCSGLGLFSREVDRSDIGQPLMPGSTRLPAIDQVFAACILYRPELGWREPGVPLLTTSRGTARYSPNCMGAEKRPSLRQLLGFQWQKLGKREHLSLTGPRDFVRSTPNPCRVRDTRRQVRGRRGRSRGCGTMMKFPGNSYSGYLFFCSSCTAKRFAGAFHYSGKAKSRVSEGRKATGL